MMYNQKPQKKKKSLKDYDSSELKICPYCSAALKKSRSRCRECHRMLPLSKTAKLIIVIVILLALAGIGIYAFVIR